MKWILVLILSIAGVGSVYSYIPQETNEIVVANITHDQVTISRRDVQLLFQMKLRYWSDGTRVTVFNLPSDHRTHRLFVRDVLNMSPGTYKQTIEKQINSGNAGNLRIVNSEAQMIREMSQTYGSIGYVSKDQLLIYYSGGVNALRIVD